MNNTGTTIIFLICMYCVNICYAQRNRSRVKTDQRFEIEIFSGVNLSQIDGDFFTGYDQSGLNSGIAVNTIFTPRVKLEIGMYYSQKGAKIPHGTTVNTLSKNDREIRLNYVEVPVLVKFMLNNDTYGSFVEFGSAIGRLTSSRIIERVGLNVDGISYAEIESNFNKTDIYAVAGFGFTLGKKLAFRIRYNYGLNKFYNNTSFVEPNALSFKQKEIEFLRNYNLTLLFSYRII